MTTGPPVSPDGYRHERVPPVKGVLKAVVFALLRYSGLSALVRHTLQSRQLTVLVFHDPSPERMARHLDQLERRYSIVTLQDVLDAYDSGNFRNLPPRPLLLTLDDGWACNHDLIAVLRQHGVRPTVFVTTSIAATRRHFWWTHVPDAELSELTYLPHVDRLERLRQLGFEPETEYDERQALSLEELRALAEVCDLQSHTRFHPVLPTCTTEVAREEITDAASELEELIGERPRAFAYPHGDYSDRDVDLVREAGYDCAFTVEPGLNLPSTDPYRLKRILVRCEAGTSELVVRASGGYVILLAALRRALHIPTP